MHIQVENWDDIRAALAVARLGTVSAAGEVLGLHHATVIRRVDALERQLGAKLFQRHGRGYALTDAGRLLLQVAGKADEDFARMQAQISGVAGRVEGDLVVTAVAGFDEVILPALTAAMRKNPGLRITYLADPRLFRLSAGEAHIAIRAGARPTEPDYVVQPLTRMRHGLVASAAYLRDHGDSRDPAHHRFVSPGPTGQNAPHSRWLRDHVDPANVVMTTSDVAAAEAIIRAGLAIGVLPPARCKGLVALDWPTGWISDLWLVTHVDLHRTPRIQAVLSELRAAAAAR